MKFTNSAFIFAGAALFLLGVASGWPLRASTRAKREPLLVPAPVLQADLPRATLPDIAQKPKALSAREDPAVIRREMEAEAREMTAFEIREVLQSLGKDWKSQVALWPLLERWIELDGKAALAYALQHELDLDRVITNWYRLDSAAAEEAVEAMPEGTAKRDAFAALYKSMADSHPAEAAARLRELPWSEAYSLHHEIYVRWARQDPQAAIRQAMNSPEASRSEAVGGVIAEWAKSDPRAALSWLNGCSDLKMRESGLAALANQWAAADPIAAVEALYQIERARASDAASGHPGPYVHGSPNACSSAVGEWLQDDFTAAWSWLKSLEEAGTRERLLTDQAGRDLIRMNPDLALKTVLQEPPSDSRSRIMASFIQNWTSYDPDEALAWIRKQQDIRVQQVVWPVAVSVLKTEKSLPLLPAMSPEIRTHAFETIVENSGDRSLPFVASWILQQPNRTEKDKYIRVLVRGWASANKEDVVGWIKTLPPGPLSDAARAALSEVP